MGKAGKILLGLGLLYTSTIMLVYNLLHAAPTPAGLALLVVQAFWYLIVFNHAVTALRLAFYRNGIRAEGRVPPLPQRLPKVSILVPVYREDPELLAGFAKAVRGLKYPRSLLEVVVVDDTPMPDGEANRRVFRSNGNGLNVVYMVRRGRDGWRGGALDTALRVATGEYVAVFDLDHQPLPHSISLMVSEAVSRGADVVFFPQRFRNSGSTAVTVAGDIGYRFDYDFSRPGKSVTNSTFAPGTNFIARRSSLLRAGGFHRGSIVEDMASGLLLWHPSGLRIDYSPAVVAYGLLPETLPAFRRQQYRWAKGAFELFPAFLRTWGRLTWFQRLDYLFHISWYLVGPTVILSSLLPLASALGVTVLLANNVLEYLMYVVALTGLQLLLYITPLLAIGEPLARVLKGQALGILVAETYTKALLDTLVGRRVGFQVTPKNDKAPGMLKLLRQSSLVLTLLYANVLAILLAIGRPDFVPIAGWAAWNSFWLVTGVVSLVMGSQPRGHGGSGTRGSNRGPSPP